MRLRALALDDTVIGRIGSGLASQALALAQTKAPELIEQQRYDVMVGSVAAFFAYLNRFRISTALVPPNPNEFDITASTRVSRALFGT